MNDFDIIDQFFRAPVDTIRNERAVTQAYTRIESHFIMQDPTFPRAELDELWQRILQKLGALAIYRVEMATQHFANCDAFRHALHQSPPQDVHFSGSFH